MKLDQLLYESHELDYGDEPKKPKNAPAIYDTLDIPDKRLWIKLESVLRSAEKKPGAKFKIKSYYSKGASTSSFYGKGRTSKDDYVLDVYEIVSFPTDETIKVSTVSAAGAGYNSYFLWSRDKHAEYLKDADPASFVERLGHTNSTRIYVDGLKLTDIRGIPEVMEELNISRNPINTFEDFPSHCKVLTAVGCKITSLTGIHKKLQYCEKLYLADCPIDSSILGLLQIKGLKEVSLGGTHDKTASDCAKAGWIINSYLKKGGDIMDCQEELIAAGLTKLASM